MFILLRTRIYTFGNKIAPTNTFVRFWAKYPNRAMGKMHLQILYICPQNHQIIAIMTEILQRIPRMIGNSPIMGNEKQWIATAAMLAGSVASSLIGGAKARKAAKKAEAENRYRSNAEKAWYDKEYNTDYLDTKAGQNLMRKAQEVQDNYVRKADGAAAVGGGTAASVAQAKESANKAMGDTIANVAAQDTARKAQVSDQHQQNVSQLSRERQQIEQNKAEATSQAAQNMSNTLMQAGVNQLGSQLQGAKGLKTNGLGDNTSLVDNKNVTEVGDRLSHKADTNGLLNPNATNGKTMLDNAVGDLMKRKPNIHV